MPKYWKEIAIEAQEEAANLAARAREGMKYLAAGWPVDRQIRIYQVRAARCYARARWAMTVPDDCP